MVKMPCSEFPNANPELHEGAIFGAAEPCGPCVLTDAAPTPKAAPAPGESGFFERRKTPRVAAELPKVDEIESFEADEHVATPAPAPLFTPAPAGVTVDGFARVQGALERIAETLAPEGAKRVQAALSGSAQLPPPIAFALLHWRALLEGEDSSSLPELTLDEWAAGLLAALFDEAPSGMKSRVRAEGIAAFGILDAA